MASQSRLARSDRAASPGRVTPHPTTSAPLSVAQEGLWYLHRLTPNRLDYNELISIDKDGPLDADALRRAFTDLLRRHEAWRTTFPTVDGQPVQSVQPVPRIVLPVMDLSDLTPEQAELQAVRHASNVARVPYDLARGPLVRPRLFKLARERHRLALAMHHIVFDGGSRQSRRASGTGRALRRPSLRPSAAAARAAGPLRRLRPLGAGMDRGTDRIAAPRALAPTAFGHTVTFAASRSLAAGPAAISRRSGCADGTRGHGTTPARSRQRGGCNAVPGHGRRLGDLARSLLGRERRLSSRRRPTCASAVSSRR